MLFRVVCQRLALLDDLWTEYVLRGVKPKLNNGGEPTWSGRLNVSARQSVRLSANVKRSGSALSRTLLPAFEEPLFVALPALR